VRLLIQPAQRILEVQALAGLAQARHSRQQSLTRSSTAGRFDINCFRVTGGGVIRCGRQANERLAMTLAASAGQHCGSRTAGGRHED
jgi:hypothetical protein